MAAFTPRTMACGPSLVTAYDHGAHIASWTEHGVPVVWVSQHSQYVLEKAIRGGIPVCWPWFAAGPQGDRAPSHGLARTATWSLVAQSADSLSWRLTDRDLAGSGADAVEGPFECTLDARIGPRTLEVALSVTNRGAEPWDYELALHTYLHVGDVRDITIQGLDSVSYFDKVAQRDAVQRGPLRIAGETDRVYRSSGPVQVQDPTRGRELAISSAGASHTVIWNPGPAAASAMADLADAEWTQMVCVETANLEAAAVVLGPGQSHTTTTRITVADLGERA